MRSIRCLKFLCSLFLVALTTQSLAQDKNWNEIESELTSLRNKHSQFLEEKKTILRQQSSGVTLEMRREQNDRLHEIQKELEDLGSQIQRRETQLLYRFPERGLILEQDNTAESSPANNSEEPSASSNKALDSTEPVIEDAAPATPPATLRALESLRRQFGRPLTQEEKKNLPSGVLEPKGTPPVKKVNPIEDKIILSK